MCGCRAVPVVKQKRLLVIDDEPALGRLVGRSSEGLGFEVTVTQCSFAFLDELIAARPHVIVLDLSLPGMDGVELLRFLAVAKCEARILVVSGFDRRVLETSARLGIAKGLNICGTIEKPFRVQDLRAALSAAVQEPATQ